MSYTIKTIPDKRTYGTHSTMYCETLAEVERGLIYFSKEKAPAVATDEKGQIVGRVIEETKGTFRMWLEPM
jgi:hypothetical protein